VGVIKKKTIMMINKLNKMKTSKLKITLLILCLSVLFVQCTDSDDNGNVILQETCDDGIQNGEEEGIDCGGPVCEPCLEGLDFSGTFVQEDVMGRPGVNTVFSGTNAVKNDYNVTLVSDRSVFNDIFEATLELYYDVYAVALEIDPLDFNYETNILGLDAMTFSSFLAEYDALQVAPDGVTTYFGVTNFLTGRNLSDDVMDTTLTLMFGGTSGTRLDGSDVNGDGEPDSPQLTFDGVDSGDRDFSLPFPYLEAPIQ
jgi:hypothetical protein